MSNDAANVINEQCAALAAKEKLLLTVAIDTPEQAEELLRWMYASSKPMKSRLLEISWDKVAVPKRHAEAIEMLREGAGHE